MQIASRSLAALLFIAATGCPQQKEDPAGEAPVAEETKPDAEAETDREATLAKIDGTVTHNGSPAKAGAPLSPGDVVKTDENGYAEVHLDDGSKIRIVGAEMTWQPGDTESTVALLVGKLYAAITPGRSFEVDTANAVAGVRGTRFFVEEKDEKAYLCVCEGQIEARRQDSDDEPTVVSAGEDLYVSKDKPTGAPTKSPDMVKMVEAVFDEMGVE